jgi:hypothetical protein
MRRVVGAVSRIGLVALVLSTVFLSEQPSAGAGDVTHVVVFRDRSSPLALSIDLEPTSREIGRFAFATGGMTYASIRGAQLRFVSATSVLATYDGLAEARPALGGPPVRVTVRMDGQIDPLHHTAEVVFVTPSQRFHLVQPATPRSGLDRSIRLFEDAMLAEDWTAMYALLDPFFARAYTAQTFATSASAATQTLGRITDLRRVSVGDVITNDLGDSIVVVVYDVTRDPGSGPKVSRYKAYFRLDGSVWRIWFSV